MIHQWMLKKLNQKQLKTIIQVIYYEGFREAPTHLVIICKFWKCERPLRQHLD